MNNFYLNNEIINKILFIINIQIFIFLYKNIFKPYINYHGTYIFQVHPVRTFIPIESS